MSRNVGYKSVTRHNTPEELRNKFYTFTSISKHYQLLQTERKLYTSEDFTSRTERSKGKTVPEKVATTRTEDGHKRNTKTSTTI